MLSPFRKLQTFVARINTQMPGNSFVVQRTAFIWMGMWRSVCIGHGLTDGHFLTRHRGFYRIFSAIVLYFFLYASIVFQVINLLFSVDNVDDLAAVAFLLITQITAAFKVQQFIAHYEEIREFLNTLNQPEFQPQNSSEKVFVRTAIARTFYMNVGYTLVCTTTITQWVTLSALNGSLIYDAWYPLDLTKPTAFVTVLVYQVVAIFINMITNTTLDVFTAGLIMHLHAQVQRLGYRLTLVGYENETSSTEEMKECIKVHQKLLKLLSIFEQIFGPSIFVQLCVSVMVFCMTGYVLATEEFGNFFEVLSRTVYFGSMLFQILMYCLEGNDLTYSSSTLMSQAFHSDFVNFDPQTKKLLLLFMQRVVPTMRMRAKLCFGFDLSLPTFILLLKSSYSYFALLQNISNQ